MGGPSTRLSVPIGVITFLRWGSPSFLGPERRRGQRSAQIAVVCVCIEGLCSSGSHWPDRASDDGGR